MTKLEAVEQARQLVAQAYKLLRDSGFDGAYALEKLQAIVLDIWTQSYHVGLTQAGGFMGWLH